MTNYVCFATVIPAQAGIQNVLNLEKGVPIGTFGNDDLAIEHDPQTEDKNSRTQVFFSGLVL
jgi:hypothetical protein